LQWALGTNFAEVFPKPGDSESAPKPVGGAVLPSLYLYRLLAVKGPKAFDDVSYLGTFPLPSGGIDGLFDVVSATYRGIDAWFYFDSRSQLAAMEVYADEHVDPLEFQFSNYHTVDGNLLPGRLKIDSGGNVFEAFDLEQFHFGEAGK
jgi:hypothetical protein